MFSFVDYPTTFLPVSYTLCIILMLMHIGFGIYEMFFWRSMGMSIAKKRDPCGLDSQNLPKAVEWAGFIAFNQGTYNLFIAGGLLFALAPNMNLHQDFALYFAGCIVVAGLAGAYTGIRAVFFLQTIPGLVLFGALYFDL
ncbi:MAG: DUF1304 domain-containing protein [Pseudomonadota bacterium]